MATTTATKSRPILMTPDNAQKCHVGTKTKTRRLVKFPQNVEAAIVDRIHYGKYAGYGTKNGWVPLNKLGGIATLAFHDHHFTCPYGVPGDRLWVREQLTLWPGHIEYSGDRTGLGWVPESDELYRFLDTYARATCPSLHMPRWACRTVLEITDIRVERLQDISEEDARAEGVEHGNVAGYDVDIDGEVWNGAYRRAFAALWQSINGPGSWAKNPWVWVIAFKKVEVNP